MRGSWALLACVLVPAVSGCSVRAVHLRDYRAEAVDPEQRWGNRLFVRVSDVRLLAGPPGVFPYERCLESGERERGQYQLYTRVQLLNSGTSAVVVHWLRARLVGPDGAPVGLVDRPPGFTGQAGTQPAPPAGTETLDPGQRSARVLMPETLVSIAEDEPLVPLCDGCEYRLEVPVSVGGREELLAVRFRLVARSWSRSRRGPLFLR